MITLICGPMFSGKSTELIRQLERKYYAGKKILYIRPIADNRDFIARGYKGKLENMANILEFSEFTEDVVSQIFTVYDAVFVDEYFMIKNCKLLCTTIPKNHKCDIYFGGLLASAENNLWPETTQIMPYCDDIIKLNAVCTECGSEHGNYTLFKGEKKKDEIVVGDKVYTAVCRKCYKKLKNIL